jgi:hypothetical protein
VLIRVIRGKKKSVKKIATDFHGFVNYVKSLKFKETRNDHHVWNLSLFEAPEKNSRVPRHALEVESMVYSEGLALP